MIVAPSSSQRSSLPGAPRGLVGSLSWRLVSETDGSEAIAESTGGIVEVDLGEAHGRRRYDRPYTAPTEEGRYRAIWRFGYQELPLVVVVAADATASFASTDDVADRLGRDLSTAETGSVQFLLKMAATVIADAASKDDGWVVTLAPVPQYLRLMSVELACRALANPNQLERLSEQLGNYSMTAAFPADRLGVTLTETEVLIVRRVVHGRTTASMRVPSSFERASRLLTWEHMQPAQRTD